MGNGVTVFDIDILNRTARAVLELGDITDAQCRNDLWDAEKYWEEVEEEERNSQFLLDVAKTIEAEKFAVLVALEAELAEAVAEAASGNPFAAARAAALGPQVAQAAQEHKEAQAHRERMAHRYDIAVQCVNLARMREEKMRIQYNQIMTTMKRTIQEGADRLTAAADTLQDYINRMEPGARKLADDWFNWKPKEKSPVMPKEVHDRLDVCNAVVDAMLVYLYNTDLGFRTSVDKMRLDLQAGVDEESIALKARKNMVGRLCEEIVIHAFLPMGEQITTQERYTLPDGTYTKVDMTLYGLKVPLILGRGENAGAQAGGSLAIEVKSGAKQYLQQQLDHMLKQAQGHQTHNISCVVCTRDIKDLSPEQESRLRMELRNAGSPIYGMLPRKESLDFRCIKFVKEGASHEI